MKAVVQRLVGSFIRGIVQPVVPLQVRQQWVVRIGQWPLLGSSFLSRELLADFAQQDPINLHHFLWSQHIGAGTFASRAVTCSGSSRIVCGVADWSRKKP